MNRGKKIRLCAKYASHAKAMCSNRILCRPGVPRKAEDKRSSPPQAALVYIAISHYYYMALAETFQPQYSQQSKGASEGEEKNLCLLKLAKQKYNKEIKYWIERGEIWVRRR